MSKPTPFDFAEFDVAEKADNPFEFELRFPFDALRKGSDEIVHRKGDPTGVFVSIVGAQGRSFKKFAHQEADKIIIEAHRRGRSKGADQPLLMADQERMKTEFVAECMRGWRTVVDGKSEPVIYLRGEALEFSKENAIRWLSHFDWVREQINDETDNLANFIRV